MDHRCSIDKIIRDVLFAAFSFICVLWCGPLFSYSAEANEKFTHTITCTNYQQDKVSCDELDAIPEISILGIESGDQNEKEEFNHNFFADRSNRRFLGKIQAILIYHLVSDMYGRLVPPPKSC